MRLYKATVEIECLFLADESLPEHEIRLQAEEHMRDELKYVTFMYPVDTVAPMTKASAIPAEYEADSFVFTPRGAKLGNVTVTDALEKYTP